MTDPERVLAMHTRLLAETIAVQAHQRRSRYTQMSELRYGATVTKRRSCGEASAILARG
jgi:hypothetical protein